MGRQMGDPETIQAVLIIEERLDEGRGVEDEGMDLRGIKEVLVTEDRWKV